MQMQRDNAPDHVFQRRPVAVSPRDLVQNLQDAVALAREVYVAETETGRLWAWDVEAPGVLKKEPWPSSNGGRVLCQFPDRDGLESLGQEELLRGVQQSVLGVVFVVRQDGSESWFTIPWRALGANRLF